MNEIELMIEVLKLFLDLQDKPRTLLEAPRAHILKGEVSTALDIRPERLQTVT
jgi:hypothetical protein